MAQLQTDSVVFTDSTSLTDATSLSDSCGSNVGCLGMKQVIITTTETQYVTLEQVGTTEHNIKLETQQQQQQHEPCGPCSQCGGTPVAQFMCFVCGASYWTQSDCQSHWITQHAGIIVSCHLCQQTFLNKSQLNAHMRTQHRNTLAATNSNGTTGTGGIEGSSSTDSLSVGRAKRQRVSRCDRQKDFVWDVVNCSSETDRVSQFNAHTDSVVAGVQGSSGWKTRRIKTETQQGQIATVDIEDIDSSSVVCSDTVEITDRLVHLANSLMNNTEPHVTGETHATGETLVTGEPLVTGDSQLTCAMCQRTLLSSKALERHMRIHCRQFECVDCGQCFKTNNNLRRHSRQHTDERPYLCPDCGHTFRVVDNLKLHMRTIHTNARPFTCQHCGMTYKRRDKLREHVLLKHETHRLLACTLCDRRFVAPYQLRDHIMAHGDLREFPCDICSKSFHTKVRLDCHRRTTHRLMLSADDSHNWRCVECGRVMSCKASLIVHQRRHAGLYPFMCADCEKCFASRAELTLHLQTHSTVRSFTCELCGNAFKRKKTLTKHLRSHLPGERRFMCKFCDAAFRTDSAMYLHRRKQHGVTAADVADSKVYASVGTVNAMDNEQAEHWQTTELVIDEAQQTVH